MVDFNLTNQKNAIAREGGIFLNQEFGFPSESVNVMMEKAMVLIRAENFLCSAEQKIGVKKKTPIYFIRCRQRYSMP
jgi:hypothetical protein